VVKQAAANTPQAPLSPAIRNPYANSSVPNPTSAISSAATVIGVSQPVRSHHHS
jgi:hypothetical protein